MTRVTRSAVARTSTASPGFRRPCSRAPRFGYGRSGCATNGTGRACRQTFKLGAYMDNRRATGVDRLLTKVVFVGGALIVSPWDVLAATAAQTTGQRTFGAGLFLAWAVAYLSRRRAIGGWVLYFYIQLYISLLFSLLFLPATLGNLRPAEWDSSKLYVLNFVSAVPVLLLLLGEVGAATLLLARRSEANVKILRKVLAALVMASAIALGIDITYFDEAATLYFDVVTLAFAVIWLAYFHKARRVRLVFIEGKWDYEACAAKRVLTPEDKRRLRRRTLIASASTFLVLLILMGIALGDKKPDAGLFFVPLFYGAIAALVAWYLPLRKRRADPLRIDSTDTPTP